MKQWLQRPASARKNRPSRFFVPRRGLTVLTGPVRVSYFLASSRSKIYSTAFESSRSARRRAAFLDTQKPAKPVFCAQERIRTSIPLRELPPQGSASSQFRHLGIYAIRAALRDPYQYAIFFILGKPFPRLVPQPRQGPQLPPQPPQRRVARRGRGSSAASRRGPPCGG